MREINHKNECFSVSNIIQIFIVLRPQAEKGTSVWQGPYYTEQQSYEYVEDSS